MDRRYDNDYVRRSAHYDTPTRVVKKTTYVDDPVDRVVSRRTYVDDPADRVVSRTTRTVDPVDTTVRVIPLLLIIKFRLLLLELFLINWLLRFWVSSFLNLLRAI